MDSTMPFPQITKAIGKLLLDIRSKRNKRSKTTTGNVQKGDAEIQDVLDKHSIQMLLVEKLSDEKFEELILENSKRFSTTTADHDFIHSDEYKDLELLINSMCHPDAIRTSCNIYLKALERQLQLTE